MGQDQKKKKNGTGQGAFLASVAAFLLVAFFVSLLLPASYSRSESKKIYFTYGTGFRKISAELRRQGMLRNPLAFNTFVLATGIHNKFKAGEYEFSTSDSALKIIIKMIKGEVLQHKVVLPEGTDIYGVAAALDAAGLVKTADFMAALRDPAVLKQCGINYPTAEGLLFPDTYNFVLGETPSRIIQAMHERFLEKSAIDPDNTYSVPGYKITGYKALILASIIEKESRLDDERPLVASVFYNRLKSPEAYQRRLESCATVRYALNKKTGIVTYKDLKTDSPYNTYIRIGLPPGPICNPGIKSMQAALNPAATKYRYFVLYENGEHTFSETLDEHNNAKRINKKIRDDQE
ncbi:MAG: endolytic transglycosylase MltG [Candidatus Goldiibacteriota bacterium]|jgi:UPF0755 protein